MDIRKIIRRRIQASGKGVNAAGDLNAVISANVNEPNSRSHVSSRTRTRIVQRSGRTEVSETHDETSEGGGDEHARGERAQR